jgi:HAMP domain-containing protein
MRKHFIVKPKIQIKYLFITVLAVVVTGLAVYFAMWSSLVNSAGLEQFTAGEWKALERAYQMSFLWVLIILVIGFGLESLVIFHRIIGPVFKFESIFRMLAAGDLSLVFSLRKHDELHDMEQEVQKMIVNFKNTVSEDRKKVEQAIALLNQGNVPEAKSVLSAVTRWFKVN